MTEAKRKRYTREFKQDAMALIACERYTIAEAARCLRVNENIRKPKPGCFIIRTGAASTAPWIVRRCWSVTASP